MAVNDDMAIANLPRASSESFSISFSSDPGKETEITCQHFLMLGLTGSNNFPTSLRPETGLDLKYRISPLDLHKTQLLGVLHLIRFEVESRKFQFGNSDRRHYLESSKCSSTTVHQSKCNVSCCQFNFTFPLLKFNIRMIHKIRIQLSVTGEKMAHDPAKKGW